MRRFSWTHGLAIVGWICAPVIAVVAVDCGSSSGSGATGGKGGSGGGTGGAGLTGGAEPDGGADGDAGGLGMTCGKLLSCDQACTSNACTDGCYAESTGVAQGLFNAFNACISDQCSSGDGGPCASPSSSACSSCNESAATGACISGLLACEQDKAMGPPDLDGGGVVVPLTDSGMEPQLRRIHTSCVGGLFRGCRRALAADVHSQGDGRRRAPLAGVLERPASPRRARPATAAPARLRARGATAVWSKGRSSAVPCATPSHDVRELTRATPPTAGTTPMILERGSAPRRSSRPGSIRLPEQHGRAGRLSSTSPRRATSTARLSRLALGDGRQRHHDRWARRFAPTPRGVGRRRETTSTSASTMAPSPGPRT